jgi:hypothetical protein
VREIEDGTRKNVGRFVKAFKEGYHSGFEK